MEGMMLWTTRETLHELTVEVERRPLVLRFYQERLVRLLNLEPLPTSTLTEEECARLRQLAVVATVGALTALDAGPLASQILRQTQSDLRG